MPTFYYTEEPVNVCILELDNLTIPLFNWLKVYVWYNTLPSSLHYRCFPYHRYLFNKMMTNISLSCDIISHMDRIYTSIKPLSCGQILSTFFASVYSMICEACGYGLCKVARVYSMQLVRYTPVTYQNISISN